MADLAVSNAAVPEQAIEEDEVEMHQEVKNSVHQRLRANSSIMQLKKLLGRFAYFSGSRYLKFRKGVP
jgi:pyruvate carboxylase